MLSCKTCTGGHGAEGLKPEAEASHGLKRSWMRWDPAIVHSLDSHIHRSPSLPIRGSFLSRFSAGSFRLGKKKQVRTKFFRGSWALVSDGASRAEGGRNNQIWNDIFLVVSFHLPIGKIRFPVHCTLISYTLSPSPCPIISPPRTSYGHSIFHDWLGTTTTDRLFCVERPEDILLHIPLCPALGPCFLLISSAPSDRLRRI